jgi:creatinine amidohydrolase
VPHRYERLRPDQLRAIVDERPVAYWPLGLIEHHGRQLPLGLDGLKAEALCCRLADRTGGVVLPVMWWGGGGGHGPFMWTLYQDEGAAARIVGDSLEKLVSFGFRAIVLMMGHYPWAGTLDTVIAAFRGRHPEILLIAGTEMDIAAPAAPAPGDHAAREETSYGLALLPDLVDLGAMTAPRRGPDWPPWGPPLSRHPGVDYDPASPTFAQMGESAALASAERGEAALGPLVEVLAARVAAWLEGVRG